MTGNEDKERAPTLIRRFLMCAVWPHAAGGRLRRAGVRRRAFIASALIGLVGAVLSSGVVQALPPSSGDAQKLLPKDTLTHDIYGLNSTGVINVIVYGPDLTQLDLPDKVPGWSSGAGPSTQTVTINGNCQSYQQDRKLSNNPEGNYPLHEEALIWTDDPRAHCSTSNVDNIDTVYAAASLRYSSKGTVKDKNGKTYHCNNDTECVLPNSATDLSNPNALSGFEYGRDGLPSGIGLRQTDSSGNTSNVNPNDFHGLANDIVSYLRKQSGWTASQKEIPAPVTLALQNSDADAFGQGKSTATYKDQYVQVICVHSTTGAFANFACPA